MKKLAILLGLALILPACARSQPTPAIGSDVRVEKKDGINVSGKLVDVKPEQVVVQAADGTKTEVPKSQIASMTSAAPDAKAPVAPAAPAAPPAPTPKEETSPDPLKREFVEVTIPAGTTLAATLGTAIASDTSKIEDPVRATLRTPVSAEGRQALAPGTTLVGHVTGVERSAKVKGRASIAFRFNTIDLPGDGGRQPIATETISRLAPATKKKDATKIGVGAGAGAAIGAIVGGGGGAAKGAVIGGAAGTGAVLATRGEEVRLAAGTPVSVKLTAPLTVRVPLRER